MEIASDLLACNPTGKLMGEAVGTWPVMVGNDIYLSLFLTSWRHFKLDTEALKSSSCKRSRVDLPPSTEATPWGFWT